MYKLKQCSFSNVGLIYHNILPWVNQYRQSVGLTFTATQVPGCPIGLVSHSYYCDMWNWSNNWWWRPYGKIIFRIIFAYGRIWYHSFRVQLVSDLHRTNTKQSLNVCIYFSALFSKISLVGTSWYMKPMPVMFLFSDTCDSLPNMCNFYWNPFLVRKTG